MMFQLKERGYILKIFEVWTERIENSNTNAKDFYNAIKIKGVELTKALIKICHYGNFVEIPKLAEGKLERADDIKDWEYLVNFYIWSCWSCICSVVTTTQTKEAVFENFLFTSKEDKAKIWELLVPESITYKFSVETDFKVQDTPFDKYWEENQDDDIIKRFNDNFFANDNILMSVPLESKVEENPQLVKRKHDKVRQILDQDEEEEDMDVDKDDEDFELDDINKHPCMQSILRVIDSLKEQFSSTWDKESMPNWMEKLHSDYKNVNNSAKLFILKVVINRPEVFQPYANYWFGYLAEYAVSKDNGGKGLHYFLRDICSIMINFNDTIDCDKEDNNKYFNEILN